MAQSSPRRTSIFHESDDGSLHNSIDLSPSPSPSHMNYNLKHEQFEKIYKIFRKPKEERDEEDVEFVKAILKTIPFFLDQQREDINFDEFLYKVYTLMNFQSFRKNEAIFHHGERGTNFYLILKGYVDVYVPKDQHELAKEVKQKVESNLKSMPRVSLAQKRRGTSNSMTRSSRLSVGGNNETERRTSVFLNPLAAEKPGERSSGVLKNFKSMQKIVKESSYVLENFTEHQDLYMKNGVPKFKKLRNLGPGQVFGEQALSSDTDVCRDNTRVAATNVHVIVFSKASWKRLFEGLEKRMNVKSDFFGNLTGQTSKEAIVKFCAGFEERSYKYGQVVFSQGQMPGEIFVIREGEVQISRHDMQDEGQDMVQRLRKTKKNIVEKKIVNVRPPHFFGEGEALLNQPYEYTAKSISNDTVVYVLSIEEFQSLKREYPGVWNGILAKYHTKMPHWKSRHSHVSKVKERLEEEQVAMRRTFSSNSNSNSSYDSSNSPNMMPTEDSHAGSAILNKKSKFKLDIKVSSNKDMSVNSDSSKKEYPLTERQSTSKSILQDLDSPMPEKDIALTLSPARRDSYSSFFGGGKQISEIVESKFKILKRQSFQKPEMTDTATVPDEIEDISLVRRSSQKKITRVATDKSLPKIAHSDEVIVPKNALNSPRSPIKLKPYEVDLAKSKIKGLNIPLLSLRTEPSVATLSPKHHKNSSSGVPTSRFLHEKLPTLGDTPKAKGPKFFSYKFTDDDYGSKQGSPRATESHKGTIGTIPDSLSPRALASIKLNPISHRPTEHTLYKAEEINYNIAEYELNAPFSTRRGALALAINSFKTSDMVYGMQEVYHKSLVAPEALNPVLTSPKSARVKPTMLHKMNPMLPSQHNMFRVKPNRAHIIMDLYKGEQESPKGKRSKK